METKTIRYAVSVAMFVDACAMTVVGLLLHFVIERGKGIESTFLGWHRREWGEMHFHLSLLFLLLIAAHIWLHREWIVRTTQSLFGEQWRRVLYGLLAGWIPVLIIYRLLAG